MIAVRAEEERDHARVDEIQAAAFGRRNEAELVRALRAAAHPSLSLVAVEADGVLGHVFFSPVALDPPGEAFAAGGLAPIAVDPAHQARGIGSALVRDGLARCRGLGWRAVFLIGAPAYYARFGFVPAAPLGFTYDPLVDPALQVVELVPGSLARRAGRVLFHAAFAETGCA